MRQKKKKVKSNKSDSKDLTEEQKLEKEAKKLDAAAEGTNLDQSMYSYYTENTDATLDVYAVNQSINQSIAQENGLSPDPKGAQGQHQREQSQEYV